VTALLSNQMPEEPSLREAFVKDMFLSKGISPKDVDELDLMLLNNLLEIESQKYVVAKARKQHEDAVRRMENGRTINQGQSNFRHQRTTKP
jgi:hypothetical protein